jgi:cholesterol transport system auxiliary component
MKASRISAVLVLCLAGCALTDRGASIEWSYFTPVPPAGGPATAPAETRGPPLVLGRVTAAANLGRKIVYRVSDVRSGEYEEKRWTERPGDYVSHALLRALFQDEGLSQELTGAAPLLDVEVVAFEELRTPSGKAGHVALRYALHDGERVLLRGTVEKERPAASSDTEDVVRAIGGALEDGARELAGTVAATLRSRAKDEASRARDEAAARSAADGGPRP